MEGRGPGAPLPGGPDRLCPNSLDTGDPDSPPVSKVLLWERWLPGNFQKK